MKPEACVATFERVIDYRAHVEREVFAIQLAWDSADQVAQQLFIMRNWRSIKSDTKGE